MSEDGDAGSAGSVKLPAIKQAIKKQVSEKVLKAREQGWALYEPKANVVPNPNYRAMHEAIEPSEEDRKKMLEIMRERKAREEARARDEVEKALADQAAKRQEEQERLEARRQAVLERIRKAHELAQQQAELKAKADAQAKAELAKFKTGTPLFQRYEEEWTAKEREAAEELRAKAEELKAQRAIRTKEIMLGKVQLTPVKREAPAAEPRAFLPGRVDPLPKGEAIAVK